MYYSVQFADGALRWYGIFIFYKAFIKILFQNLNMVIQRANVASVLGTALSVKKLDELYYM